jgi:enoyl-CoA hydratase
MARARAIRAEDDGAVRHLVLCRPAEYNTITVALRDELGAALDEADRDHRVRVVLVRAEGEAFCAGFGLDWSTLAQASESGEPSEPRESPGAGCGTASPTSA